MTRGRGLAVAAALTLLLVPAGTARAAQCPPGSPAPVFTVNGKATGPVYTTRDLTARVKLSGGAFYTADSFNVTGVRRIADPSGDDPRPDEIHGIADSPGTLTATATLTNYDLDCTVSGSATFEIRQATAPVVSPLRRPRPFKGHRGWVWDSKFWFWVKPGSTGDARPITVEARAIRKARLPGAGVAAKSVTFPMRPSDGTTPDLDPHGNCRAYELICPRHIRTWPDGAEVDVRPMGGREVPALVKVTVVLPRGVPTLHYSLRKTPIGLDVKVLQGGAPIARVRMAGRCDPEGQFSRCRFKKLSTAL